MIKKDFMWLIFNTYFFHLNRLKYNHFSQKISGKPITLIFLERRTILVLQIEKLISSQSDLFHWVL